MSSTTAATSQIALCHAAGTCSIAAACLAVLVNAQVRTCMHVSNVLHATADTAMGPAAAPLSAHSHAGIELPCVAPILIVCTVYHAGMGNTISL
jgi:hypothetical protein